MSFVDPSTFVYSGKVLTIPGLMFMPRIINTELGYANVNEETLTLPGFAGILWRFENN